jgi:hypothetical protein
MNKQTPNIQRRTPNLEWLIRFRRNRVMEEAPVYGAAHKEGSTPNAQRPTLNHGIPRVSTWKIDSWNLVRGSSGLPTVCQIRGRPIILLVSCFAVGLLHMEITGRSGGITRGFYPQTESLLEGAEGDSTLATARCQVIHDSGFENVLDSHGNGGTH